MKKTKESFNKRRLEIEKYFDLLQKLDKDNPNIHYEELGISYQMKVDVELLKILKANGFLLIYNLIESTCKNSLWEILTSIHTQKLTLKQLTSNTQQLWVKHKIKDHKNSKDSTLEKLVHAIAIDIINGVSIEFKNNTEFIDISGNIDAAKIREIGKIYDFNFRLDNAKEKAGADLLEIKSKRNNLAHGDITFADCGKEYSVSQMVAYKNNAILYIDGILNNIEDHIKNKKFKNPVKKRAKKVTP